MDTKTRRRPGTAVLVATGVVLVAVIVGLGLLGPRTASEFEPGTPEAAAQTYVQALLDGDYDVAYEMLSPDLQEGCRPNDLRMADGMDIGTAVFENVRIRDERATIEMRLTETFEPGELPLDEQDIETRLALDMRDGEWRVVAADWPLYGCEWRES